MHDQVWGVRCAQAHCNFADRPTMLLDDVLLDLEQSSRNSVLLRKIYTSKLPKLLTELHVRRGD